MTDLRVLAFVGSTEAKYSSTELNLGEFVSFRLFVGRFFIKRVHGPNDKGQPPSYLKQEREFIPKPYASSWVGRTAWISPITLNVAHEAPTKSSAR